MLVSLVVCVDGGNPCEYTLPIFGFQLVSNAIQFLASVCERPHYKHLFEDQNTLTSICEKVIVPNMEFRSESESSSRNELNCDKEAKPVISKHLTLDPTHELP